MSTVTGRRIRFVLYRSPYGSGEWLPPEVAERRLVADLKVWNREKEEGRLTARQLEHGPPRIEQ